MEEKNKTKESHEEEGGKGENGRKNDNFLAISIMVAAVLISGSLIYSANRSPSVATQPTAPSAAPTAAAPTQQPTGDTSKILAIGSRDVVLGDPKAPVTVIEYADYQCPFCGRFFTQVTNPLRDDYIKSGKVKMVFRDFAFLGPESTAAAEAAECAKDQGKYWLFHDALFNAEIADGQENSGNLTPTLFLKLAKDVGMDTKAFGTCVDSHKYADEVQKSAADGRAIGVQATPTTFVDGQMISGAIPYSQFKSAIDAELAKGS
ncbi:MAG TPA: DsbA family protein [Candidatus Paceibacterota bacterium]|nr:DsbA family protein [Candidatus Paceibacterota bacterium]